MHIYELEWFSTGAARPDLHPTVQPSSGPENLESQRLQYDLRQVARECGWDPQDVEIIDADLEKTGSTVVGREGLKRLITRVTLGQVGIIFSYDVTRLSRNCTEWYQLLDLCGYRHRLIGDRDGIYYPPLPTVAFCSGSKADLRATSITSGVG